jgi:hypothetical protein
MSILKDLAFAVTLAFAAQTGVAYRRRLSVPALT